MLNKGFEQFLHDKIRETTDSTWLKESIEIAKATGSNNFKQQLNQTLDTVEKNNTQKQINALESNFGTSSTDFTKKSKWG